MKPEIKIEPSSYKGWTLAYQESHNHENDWKASKGASVVYASSPQQLTSKIDQEEIVTLRLKTPIKALFKDPYSNNLVPVSIHSVVQDRIYFTRSDGTEGVCYLKDTRPDGESKQPFIHRNKFNDKILIKHKKQADKIRFWKAMNKELLKRLKPVTDADILLAAK